MIIFGRRVLLRAIVPTIAYCVGLGRPGRILALDGASRGVPPPGTRLPFRDFLELARLVTGKSELSEPVGQRLLSLYESTPDRLERLRDLHCRVAAAADTGGESPIDANGSIRLVGEADQALGQAARQLLEEWYTGIYQDDRQELVFSYDEALMYRPCADVHPVPMRCGGEMGFWTKPPPGSPKALISRPDPLPARN